MSTSEAIPQLESEEIRVLHVDDEPGLSETVATFLERANERLSVETTDRPADGLDRILDCEFDCIVSDYDMPEKNGVEFLKAVRATSPDIPFILYTGKGSEEIASDAISAGATDYLQKESGTDQYTVLANRIINVVERARAQATMGEIQHLFTALADRSNDILWLFSSDWEDLVFISTAYEDIFGQSRTTLEENPVAFMEATHPGDRPRIRQAMQDLSDGESIDIEVRVNEAEEYTRYAWIKGDPIMNANGAVTHVGGFTRDITANVERKRELERTRDLLEHTEHIADVGGWEIDTETQEVFWTEHLFDLLGVDYDEEPPLAKALDVYHEADRPTVTKAVEDALAAGESFDVDARYCHSSGDVRWFQIQGEPTVEDGVVVTLRGAVQDITEHKEREEEMEETTSRLEVLFENSPDMIDVLDTEGTLLDVNQRFCEELGYEKSEVLGRPIWEIDQQVDENDTMSLLDEFDSAERRKFEGVYRRRDGSTFPVEIHLLRLDVEGQDRFLAISRDISERKKQELGLEQRNQQLEQFASVVSHDLRNPLNVAQGRLELAQEECDSEHLGDIENALARSQALIEDLLTLAKEGTQVSDIEAVDIGVLAENCWRNVETGEARITVETDSTIRADRSRLTQLLENLYRNAIEHGGDDVTVIVGDFSGGFYVEDDGPGISEDNRKDVFDVGFSTAESGTGFGLSIIKQIANAHGWEVGITESETGGARIEFTGVERFSADE